MATAVLPCIELESGPSPSATVIVLHGLGADGNDFVPIVEELDLPEALPVRFVFPHAPVRRVTINGGYAMRAWYDIAEADLSNRADLAGVRQSRAELEELVRREQSRGIDAKRIILAGFSQGGAIALYTALRYPERIAGVIALSTYLIDGASLKAEASEANKDVPIFMAHGTQDTVVRLQWADQSRKLLQSMNYPVEWHTYAMPHSVVKEEIAAIGEFVVRVLKG